MPIQYREVINTRVVQRLRLSNQFYNAINRAEFGRIPSHIVMPKMNNSCYCNGTSEMQMGTWLEMIIFFFA